MALQDHLWSGANWLLLASLVLGSAGLAFLGDILGTMYGKQRVSLFGLRPKHTSRLIAALTGSLIAVSLLAIASLLSQDVRTALFSMKYVQQQLFDLRLRLRDSEEQAARAQEDLSLQHELVQLATTSLDLTRMELGSLRNDLLLIEQERAELEVGVQTMREEAERLEQELRVMKGGAIALSANALLAQRTFEPGTSRDDALAGLDALRQAARLDALMRVSDQALTRLRDVQLEFDPQEEAGALARIVSSDERVYVRVLSRENVAFGDAVPVRLEHGTSILVYPAGGIVYRRAYDASLPGFAPEEVLHSFLRELKIVALRDGVLPDPATNNVGTLAGEAFFDAVDSLREIHAPVIIDALAVGDVHTEGPVIIELAFEE